MIKRALKCLALLATCADMLAWVHTSLASEREFLLSLFGEDADSAQQQQQDRGSASMAAAAAAAAAAGDAAMGADGAAPTIEQLLDSVFESICRPLKVGSQQRPQGLPASCFTLGHCMQHMQTELCLPAPSLPLSPPCCLPNPVPLAQVRIEQVLMSSPPPLLCFRLSQLLTFYLATVEGLLGAGSQLAGAWAGRQAAVWLDFCLCRCWSCRHNILPAWQPTACLRPRLCLIKNKK